MTVLFVLIFASGVLGPEDIQCTWIAMVNLGSSHIVMRAHILIYIHRIISQRNSIFHSKPLFAGTKFF